MCISFQTPFIFPPIVWIWIGKTFWHGMGFGVHFASLIWCPWIMLKHLDKRNVQLFQMQSLHRLRWHISQSKNALWVPLQFRMISCLGWLKTQRDWGAVFRTDVLKSDPTSQMQIVFDEHFGKDLLHTLMTFLERQSDLFHVKDLSGTMSESSKFLHFSLRMCCWLEFSFSQTFENTEAGQFEFDVDINYK